MKRFLLPALLVPCGVAGANEAVCDNPDDPILGADKIHWVLVREAQVAVEETRRVMIRQLRSRETTGCGGAEQPLKSLRVEIYGRGRMLYRFDGGSLSEDFWLGRRFVLRDVMGLGVPQVIFDSGYDGASDWTAHQHIVPLTGSLKFHDVASQAFDASWRETLGWFSSSTGPYAVKAIPVVGSPDDDPDGFCHSCTHPYRYVVYQWRAASSGWEIVKEIDGSQKFDAAVDPVVQDRQYIRERLP